MHVGRSISKTVHVEMILSTATEKPPQLPRLRHVPTPSLPTATFSPASISSFDASFDASSGDMANQTGRVESR
ncbi:uncharacterized protein N7515_004746 [Penicillium bovifimosum]|uniref:Uncharacterized protein n=1 Tax=Penicillium bovifimosum TaxID=126998 RepID=A0A9W9L3M3_9EURO|nr:uncharacterized protein N7515_004746 [Penicillium bovifimosum]KAJ5135468.1 hypothetical protein N7515_004746 [Penicillium bovifimosum]